MNKKGSLFHISKRDALPLPKALLIRGGILVLALVFCGLVTTLLTGQNPIEVYGTILDGAFGSSRRIGVTARNVAVLLGISLAVTPAFKMRFWNIGAEGQTLIGCLATTTCMILLGGKVPVVVVDHHGDESADVYGTITHNRARGTHLLDPMKAIVKKLMDEGKTVDEIGKQLGMKPEEIFRLSGFTKDEFLNMMTKGHDTYSKAQVIRSV